jgi:hypothetical protein
MKDIVKSHCEIEKYDKINKLYFRGRDYGATKHNLRKLLEKGVIDPNVKSSVHGQTHRSLLEVAVTNKSSMNSETAAALIEFGADIKQRSPAHLIKFKREGTVVDLIKANNDGKLPENIADAVRKSLTKKLGLPSPSSVTEQKGAIVSRASNNKKENDR